MPGALSSYLGDAAVQHRGCRAVVALATSGDGEGSEEKLDAAGTCEAMVVLQGHTESAELQHSACLALAQFSVGSEARRVALGAAGACEAVATAMGAHPGSAAVQSTGSFAVSTLCDGGESGAVNRDRLLGAGAREAVLVAVRLHAESAEVRHFCGRAVASLDGEPTGAAVAATIAGSSCLR